MRLALQSKQFTDVKFIVNGREYPCHLAVLAVRCPAILEKFSNAKQAVLDVNETLFPSVLDYIYTDRLGKYIISV
jgi:hypothetical protein